MPRVWHDIPAFRADAVVAHQQSSAWIPTGANKRLALLRQWNFQHEASEHEEKELRLI